MPEDPQSSQASPPAKNQGPLVKEPKPEPVPEPKRKEPRGPGYFFRSLVVPVAIALFGAYLIQALIIKPYMIPSSSMEPALHCADGPGCTGKTSTRVLANRFIWTFEDPQRGDIAVFRANQKADHLCGSAQGTVFIKRIVGLPGDRISTNRGRVFIDHQPLDEPYLKEARYSGSFDDDFGTLGPDQYFMMGDNRDHSCDSRIWGPIRRSDFIGPAQLVYWPLDQFRILH